MTLQVAQLTCCLHLQWYSKQEVGTGSSSRWRRGVTHEKWTGCTLLDRVSQVVSDTAHKLCSMLHEALGERALSFCRFDFLTLFLYAFPCLVSFSLSSHLALFRQS